MSIGRAGKQGKGLHSKNREEGLLGEQGACGQLPTCHCALLLTEEMSLQASTWSCVLSPLSPCILSDCLFSPVLPRGHFSQCRCSLEPLTARSALTSEVYGPLRSTPEAGQNSSTCSSPSPGC